MNNEKRTSKIVTLKQGQSIYLGGLPFLTLADSSQPLLKVTVDLNPINNGDQAYIFDYNQNDWLPIDNKASVVGLGDKILLSKIQILVTTYSKKYGSIRFSLRTSEPSLMALLSNCTWR